MPIPFRASYIAVLSLAALSVIAPSQAAADVPTAEQVAALKKLGARLTFDEQERLIGVNLSERRIADADLVHLVGLTDVTELDLTRTGITSVGLAHLKDLKSLKVLYLTDTKVDDAGIPQIKAIKSLEFLGLSGTKITDAALAHLRELPKLGKLFCLGTKVTGAGVAELQRALPECLITN
jgi:hypothetical protein